MSALSTRHSRVRRHLVLLLLTLVAIGFWSAKRDWLIGQESPASADPLRLEAWSTPAGIEVHLRPLQAGRRYLLFSRSEVSTGEWTLDRVFTASGDQSVLALPPGPSPGRIFVAGLDVDTDKDGLPDPAEKWLTRTDPLVVDSNFNGISDGAEDTDGDGVPDGWEIRHGLNFRLPDAAADPDGDGLSNLEEFLVGRNPMVAGAQLDTSGAVRLKVFTPLK